MMEALIVTTPRVVVDREILIDEPGIQVPVVLQIKTSQHHHILIFMLGCHSFHPCSL
jgi:hypothetical protein